MTFGKNFKSKPIPEIFRAEASEARKWLSKLTIGPNGIPPRYIDLKDGTQVLISEASDTQILDFIKEMGEHLNRKDEAT